jgi:tetratricopeptide (TPR) repeat protein
MMKARWSIVIVASALAAARWLAPSNAGPPAAAPVASSAVQGAQLVSSVTSDLRAEEDRRARDIVFYERRVLEDTASAVDQGVLAGLYMQRARATGDFADFARAERLARSSLARRTSHNGQTFALLASALLARHDFTGALDVARRAHALDPETPAHLALMGEIELEIGDYAAADSHFHAIRFDGEQFTIGARIARWRELTGRVDAARRLLQGAALRADRRDDLPREQIAWFHYRLGDLELRAGRFAAADSAFRTGLAIFPEDYRILGGLARLAAARGDWRGSIDYGNRAIAIQLDPAVLGTISDAYAALGDPAQAAQYARAMTINALRQPGPIHRAWGMFVLDHGTPRDVDRVLAKTRVESRTRHDVYGADLLSWALYRKGRYADARIASARALSQHTEDAQLHYHAGLIALASADTAAATSHLEEAMRLNASFSPSQSPIARRVLDALHAAAGDRHGTAYARVTAVAIDSQKAVFSSASRAICDRTTAPPPHL